MGPFIYKFSLCIIVALCAVESFEYVVFNTLPNSDIALVGMFICALLLIERLYILLFIEQIQRMSEK